MRGQSWCDSCRPQPTCVQMVLRLGKSLASLMPGSCTLFSNRNVAYSSIPSIHLAGFMSCYPMWDVCKYLLMSMTSQMPWDPSPEHLPKEETYVSSMCVAEMCWQLFICGMHQGWFLLLIHCKGAYSHWSGGWFSSQPKCDWHQYICRWWYCWNVWHVQAWWQSCLHYLPDGHWILPKKTKLHCLNEPVLFSHNLYQRFGDKAVYTTCLRMDIEYCLRKQSFTVWVSQFCSATTYTRGSVKVKDMCLWFG